MTLEGPSPAPAPQTPPALQALPQVTPPTAARLKTLVENLGSAFPAVRESVESEFLTWRPRAPACPIDGPLPVLDGRGPW